MLKWASNFIKFGEAEIEKQVFYSSKSAITINNIDINMITISDKFSCSRECSKYLFRYINNKKSYAIVWLCKKRVVI